MVEVAKKSRTPYADRLAQAMSQPENPIGPVELAEKLEISPQAIYKLLRGESKEMTAGNNARVARILNVDPTWLATGEGTPRPIEFQVRWHERTLLELLRQLPTNEQDEFAIEVEARCAIHQRHAGAASANPFADAPLTAAKRARTKGRQ